MQYFLRKTILFKWTLEKFGAMWSEMNGLRMKSSDTSVCEHNNESSDAFLTVLVTISFSWKSCVVDLVTPGMECKFLYQFVSVDFILLFAFQNWETCSINKIIIFCKLIWVLSRSEGRNVEQSRKKEYFNMKEEKEHESKKKKLRKGKFYISWISCVTVG